jgi:hypothetical protein
VERSGKIAAALLLGLAFEYFAGPRWSAWNETVAAMAFCITACFLAALSIGGVVRGPGARPAVVVFALSLLVQPAFHGGVRVVPGILAYLGILEVLPALAGGFAGLALQRFNPRIWWFAVPALLATGLIAIGPPR